MKFLATFLLATVAYAQHFETVSSFKGIGSLASTVVAQGKDGERVYADFSYGANGFDILSVDPATGNTQVFHSPVAGEMNAWNLAVSPKGNVFLGTSPTAHVLELDTKQRQLTDRGRPSAGEQYIWDMAFGTDNKLYGVTFPGCKLIRYEPGSGRMEDLGKLDPTEQYARSIVASSDGFIYAGIGSSKANIAAYDIRTGERREILPADAQVAGFARVYRGRDGNIYGTIAARNFHLNDWSAIEVKTAVPVAATNVLHDGRTVAISDDSGSIALTITDPKTNQKVDKKLSYQGQSLQLMRLAFGPDGALYGSTAVPMNLVKLSGGKLEKIAYIGAGEVYSFLSTGPSLLIADYAGPSPLLSYTPGNSLRQMSFRGASASWRPMAMINGPDGNVYIGGLPGYGVLGSPLVQFSPKTNAVEQFDNIVANQSIVSLATWKDDVIGGTSISGGPGSHTAEKEAQIFIWDTKTHHKEIAIVPVRGASQVTDLITSGDLIYGIAGHAMFVFDPISRRVTDTVMLPFSNPVYNSVAPSDGKIWGLTQEGIFTIDTKTNKVNLIPAPVKITGGFAMQNNEVYFISDTTIYRFRP